MSGPSSSFSAGSPPDSRAAYGLHVPARREPTMAVTRSPGSGCPPIRRAGRSASVVNTTVYLHKEDVPAIVPTDYGSDRGQARSGSGDVLRVGYNSNNVPFVFFNGKGRTGGIRRGDGLRPGPDPERLPDRVRPDHGDHPCRVPRQRLLRHRHVCSHGNVRQARRR